MAGILKWLFGGFSSDDSHTAKTARDKPRGKAHPESEPEIIRAADPALPGQPYFTQLERLTSSVSAKDYPAAAAAARASLPLLRSWLEDPRGDGRRLDIWIPALSHGGTMMAITGDRDGLSELRKLVQDFDHLKAYRNEAEEHFVDLDLFNRIRDVIRGKPGMPQNQMKAELGIDGGRRASRLVSYLEKSGEVRRAKSGKTYELYMAGVDMPEAAAKTIYTEPDNPGSHRGETRATRPRELDPKRVSIVPLPRPTRPFGGTTAPGMGHCRSMILRSRMRAWASPER
jgi:hypothetical protein